MNCKIIKNDRWLVIFFLLIGCLGFHTLLSQERTYQRSELIRDQWQFEALDTLANSHIYKIQDVYVITYRDMKSAWFNSQKVEVRNEDGRLIFKTSSNGVELQDPVVFKSGNPKAFDVMLLGEETDEVNLGFHAYLIKKNVFKSIGRIDVAVFDDLGYFKSVLPYLDISLKGKEIIFRFDTTREIVLQPNSNQEQVYLGQDFSYVYRDDKLELQFEK